jgi:predicted nuclease of predicted toxin-antitoxin system
VRIKVDEDLPREIAAVLVRAGNDAVTVADEGLTGATDDRLWEAAQVEQRVLFTADKGFGDVRTRPPGTHAGVVLFRLEEERPTRS